MPYISQLDISPEYNTLQLLTSRFKKEEMKPLKSLLITAEPKAKKASSTFITSDTLLYYIVQYSSSLPFPTENHVVFFLLTPKMVLFCTLHTLHMMHCHIYSSLGNILSLLRHKNAGITHCLWPSSRIHQTVVYIHLKGVVGLNALFEYVNGPC